MGFERPRIATAGAAFPTLEPGSSTRVGQQAGTMRRSWFAGVVCMSLLISALVTFLVVILVLYLVNMLPIDGRAKQIIRIIVIIIGVLSLLRPLMYGGL
jgi:hypothetical protein